MSVVLTEDSGQDTNQISGKDIRLSAMNLLARREHSRRELQEKLGKRFDNSRLISGVLTQLEADGLLSDQRYSEAYVNGRANKLYGPERIRHELRQAGINDALIEKTLDEAGIDWQERLLRLKQKKFGNLPTQGIEERAKQQRFFQYRGFDAGMIWKIDKLQD
jgi:regulatory protein